MRWRDWTGGIGLTLSVVVILTITMKPGQFDRSQRRWIGVILVTLLTVTIETVQLIFLSARVASLGDVIANSLGGWIGLGAAVLLLLVISGRRGT